MKRDKEKNRIKQELKRLFKSMDFICDNYLTPKEDVHEKDIEAIELRGVYEWRTKHYDESRSFV